MQYKPPKMRWIPEKILNWFWGAFWILVALGLIKLALEKLGIL